jgi:hypothetical protein
VLADFFTSSNASDQSKMKRVKILCGLVLSDPYQQRLDDLALERKQGHLRRYLLSAAGSSVSEVWT